MLLTSAMMFVFICFSESRSGMLASLTGTLVLLYFESEKFRSIILQKRTVLILVPQVLLLLYAAYRFKADSANGRLLIWRVSLEMLKDSPLLGVGRGGFLAHYMEYQADYLSEHHNTPFVLLADNVNNTFNEYIMLLVTHGIVGFAIIAISTIFVLRSLYKNKTEGPIMLVLAIVLAIWAFFSYPIGIPFVWVITGLIVLVALSGTNTFWFGFNRWALSVIYIIGIIYAISRYIPERDWKIASERSIQGETERVLPEYERLYALLASNPNFLYNYGAELRYSGHYIESLNILKECTNLLNDYDVQMLMADDYQQLGDTTLAISHYSTAGRMVPSKFMPLYYLMKLYETMGNSANTVSTASSILSKEVKIEHSKSVQRIIREAGEVLNSYSHTKFVTTTE